MRYYCLYAGDCIVFLRRRKKLKISIESIIGSARRIQGLRQEQHRGAKEESTQVHGDVVSVDHKANVRLTEIESELRTIQNSLTRNQVIEDGLRRLQDDLRRGGENATRILNETTYENNRVLASFVGEHLDSQTVEASLQRVRSLIGDDVMRLRSLQVEAENLLASGNIQENAIERILNSITNALSNSSNKTSPTFTIDSESVKKLVR